MKLLANLVLLFIIAQLIGMLTGSVILNDLKITPYVENYVVKEEAINPYVQEYIVTKDSEDPFNALYFFGYVIFGAVLVLVIMNFYKGKALFKILEIFLISSASSIVFYSVLRFFYGYELSILGGIVIGLIFAIAKFFYPMLKNSAAILATAGVGVIFGISFGITPILILLVLLSIYDFIAVFKTRHMVKMAEYLIKEDLAFTITARLSSKEKPGSKTSEKLNERERTRIDLGTGDIVAPIMFEVSALSVNPMISLFVFIGAVSSITLFVYLAMRKKVVLPALPPITLGMIIFFVLGKLIGAY